MEIKSKFNLNDIITLYGTPVIILARRYDANTLKWTYFVHNRRDGIKLWVEEDDLR